MFFKCRQTGLSILATLLSCAAHAAFPDTPVMTNDWPEEVVYYGFVESYSDTADRLKLSTTSSNVVQESMYVMNISFHAIPCLGFYPLDKTMLETVVNTYNERGKLFFGNATLSLRMTEQQLAGLNKVLKSSKISADPLFFEDINVKYDASEYRSRVQGPTYWVDYRTEAVDYIEPASGTSNEYKFSGISVFPTTVDNVFTIPTNDVVTIDTKYTILNTMLFDSNHQRYREARCVVYPMCSTVGSVFKAVRTNLPNIEYEPYENMCELELCLGLIYLNEQPPELCVAYLVRGRHYNTDRTVSVTKSVFRGSAGYMVDLPEDRVVKVVGAGCSIKAGETYRFDDPFSQTHPGTAAREDAGISFSGIMGSSAEFTLVKGDERKSVVVGLSTTPPGSYYNLRKTSEGTSLGVGDLVCASDNRLYGRGDTYYIEPYDPWTIDEIRFRSWSSGYNGRDGGTYTISRQSVAFHGDEISSITDPVVLTNAVEEAARQSFVSSFDTTSLVGIDTYFELDGESYSVGDEYDRAPFSNINPGKVTDISNVTNIPIRYAQHGSFVVTGTRPAETITDTTSFKLVSPAYRKSTSSQFTDLFAGGSDMERNFAYFYTNGVSGIPWVGGYNVHTGEVVTLGDRTGILSSVTASQSIESYAFIPLSFKVYYTGTTTTINKDCKVYIYVSDVQYPFYMSATRIGATGSTPTSMSALAGLIYDMINSTTLYSNFHIEPVSDPLNPRPADTNQSKDLSQTTSTVYFEFKVYPLTATIHAQEQQNARIALEYDTIQSSESGITPQEIAYQDRTYVVGSTFTEYPFSQAYPASVASILPATNSIAASAWHVTNAYTVADSVSAGGIYVYSDRPALGFNNFIRDDAHLGLYPSVFCLPEGTGEVSWHITTNTVSKTVSRGAGKASTAIGKKSVDDVIDEAIRSLATEGFVVDGKRYKLKKEE